MGSAFGCQSMVKPLRRVIVKRPEDAFRSKNSISEQWMALGYTAPPDLQRAISEHEQFVALLKQAGAEVLCLPADDRTGLDSIYTHDPGLITEAGAIVFQTGKVARRGEGPALADALQKWDVPVLATLEGKETAEGGDMIWLDHCTLLVGLGFRTNLSGVQKMRALLSGYGITVLEFHLPYWTGPGDVLHLMSFISMLDHDLAVVYRRLLPVPLYEILTERGIQMIDVPEEEYATQGCNVLALAPRNVLLLKSNPGTRSRLETAGCQVQEFEGNEISFKGSGGPTCLTRPLLRT